MNEQEFIEMLVERAGWDREEAVKEAEAQFHGDLGDNFMVSWVIVMGI